MVEEILDIARVFGGGMTDGEAEALESLCAAAEAELAGRLREGVEPSDCREAFCCACAWMALAALSAAQGADGLSQLKTGGVTVCKMGGGAASEALRAQAELMIAPYAADTGFTFRGVRG